MIPGRSGGTCGASRIVLVSLAERADAGGVVDEVTYAQLAAETGLARVTVRAAVARLEALGLVAVEERYDADGGQLGNRYHLAWGGDTNSPQTPLVAPLRGAPTPCSRHSRCAGAPCSRRGTRRRDANPRRLGTNPRALGCSPRQLRRLEADRARQEAYRRAQLGPKSELGRLMRELERMLGPSRVRAGDGRSALLGCASRLVGLGWGGRRAAREIAAAALPRDVEAVPALLASRARRLLEEPVPGAAAAAAAERTAAELASRSEVAAVAPSQVASGLDELPDDVREQLLDEATVIVRARVRLARPPSPLVRQAAWDLHQERMAHA